MRPEFWRGKSVFVTGHTGFKGGWLCLWLKSVGADVVGYSLPPETTPSLFEVAHVADGMKSVIADVRSFHDLENEIQRTKPEVIFHLAAQPLVRRSYTNPRETYETNVMGTVNLLDAVRKVGGVRAVLIVTSDKCYENKEWMWPYRETEPLGGYDPYSNSKGCAELVTSAFRTSFFNPAQYSRHGVALASARAGNVIGGGDWSEDRLIPDIVRALAEGAPVRIRNPGAVRPWQHVLDPLDGYLSLAEKLIDNGAEFADAWNFGPRDSDAKTVEWIVSQLTTALGTAVKWEKDLAPHAHEATYLRLDSSKSRTLLAWEPKLSLPTALRFLVDWYNAFEANEDMASFTRRQIESYLTLKAQDEGF
jgi:CDP-glucose 4,6-dehydratase